MDKHFVCLRKPKSDAHLGNPKPLTTQITKYATFYFKHKTVSYLEPHLVDPLAIVDDFSASRRRMRKPVDGR
jgi:hypothetical protein